MIRTQIQLTVEQSARVQEAARRSGVSSAEIIRQSIDRCLGTSASGRMSSPAGSRHPALEILGMFDSGATDIGVRHDEYLEEAYAAHSEHPVE